MIYLQYCFKLYSLIEKPSTDMFKVLALMILAFNVAESALHVDVSRTKLTNHYQFMDFFKIVN